ncbi:MAG: hypothetical protein Sapg2KO_11810 [Saprospiraceae bacterium]
MYLCHGLLLIEYNRSGKFIRRLTLETILLLPFFTAFRLLAEASAHAGYKILIF